MDAASRQAFDFFRTGVDGSLYLCGFDPDTGGRRYRRCLPANAAATILGIYSGDQRDFSDVADGGSGSVCPCPIWMGRGDIVGTAQHDRQYHFHNGGAARLYGVFPLSQRRSANVG